MAAQTDRKPNIADFFKPRSAIPQKRPSPSEASTKDHNAKKSRSPTPHKPSTPSRPRDGGVRNHKSPSAPSSATSIPFRSPRPSSQLANPGNQSGTSRKSLTSLRYSSPSSGHKISSPSPFTPTFERTQRSIVKDGEVVEVLGSDEESDTDSLPSLSDMLKPHMPTSTSQTSSETSDEDVVELRRRKLLEKFTRTRSKSQEKNLKNRKVLTSEPKKKIDMNQLLGEYFDDRNVDSLFANAQQDSEGGQTIGSASVEDGVNRDALASLVRSESDTEEHTKRLLSAVERTEVFLTQKKYTFFQDESLDDASTNCLYASEYVNDAQHHHTWSKEETRSRAMFAGYGSQVARQGKLPNSFLKWMFYNVAIQTENELRSTYIEVLRQASPLWTRTNVSVGDIQMLFEILGARAEALQDGPIEETRSSSTRRNHGRKAGQLVSVLTLCRVIIPDMEFAALGRLTAVIVRLVLDSDVMSETRFAPSVEETLASLVNHRHQEVRDYIADKLLDNVTLRLLEPTLQALLLNHLLPTTSYVARLRMCLAHRCLFGKNSLVRIRDPLSVVSLPQITKRVQSATFSRLVHDTGQDQKWAFLKATTQLLDIAIADGDRPSDFASRKDQRDFNRLVDDLADAVGDVCASITDTGASHMRRTEAKEALRGLHFRLLYSVRTEPRPLKNVFGLDGDDCRAVERSKAFMKKFFLEQDQVKVFGAKVRGEGDISVEASKQHQQQQPPLSSQSTGKTDMSENEALIRCQLGLS